MYIRLMKQLESNLHGDELHPTLRWLEHALREWDLWLPISPMQAREALAIARINGEQTKKDSPLSQELREIIHIHQVNITEVLKFVQDEFIFPYDRMLVIAKAKYSAQFWEKFESMLISELCQVDMGMMELKTVTVDVEWESEKSLMTLPIESHGNRSYQALMILSMIEQLVIIHSGKKLLSISLWY